MHRSYIVENKGIVKGEWYCPKEAYLIFAYVLCKDKGYLKHPFFQGVFWKKPKLSTYLSCCCHIIVNLHWQHFGMLWILAWKVLKLKGIYLNMLDMSKKTHWSLKSSWSWPFVGFDHQDLEGSLGTLLQICSFWVV